MKWTSLLAAGLAAGIFSLGAAAQPAPGGGPGGGGPGGGAPAGGPRQPAQADCSKARNPAACEARQKAREACKDRKWAEFRQCVQDNMPPPDCGKARNPQRCETMNKAREACKGKYGREHRQCMRDQLRPPAPN